MIFVVPEIEEEIEFKKVVEDTIREKYNSFYHILKSIKPILNPFMEQVDIQINKEYLKVKELPSLDSQKGNLIVEEYNN